MDVKTMQKIVDGAPKGAIGYSTQSNDYFYGQKWIDGTEYLLCDLRTELAKHDTLDLEPADIPHGTIVLEKQMIFKKLVSGGVVEL